MLQLLIEPSDDRDRSTAARRFLQFAGLPGGKRSFVALPSGLLSGEGHSDYTFKAALRGC
jgi:hypothetical protein